MKKIKMNAIWLLIIILISFLPMVACSSSTGDNTSTLTYQSREDVAGSFEMNITVLCTIKITGMQTVGRVVKLPISDIVYFMSNGMFEPILNSAGNPMTIQEFEELTKPLQ